MSNVLMGPRQPTVSDGADGDYWLDNTTWMLWANASGSWTPQNTDGSVQIGSYINLQLISPWDVSKLTPGKNLLYVGIDSNGLLHIRTYDAAGVAIDTYETQASSNAPLYLVTGTVQTLETNLLPTQITAITNLKASLPSPQIPLSSAAKVQVISQVESIVGQPFFGQPLPYQTIIGAKADGSVNILGTLVLSALSNQYSGMYANWTASLQVDKSGNVSSSPESVADQFYVQVLAPLFRDSGEVSITQALQTGKATLTMPDDWAGGKISTVARSFFDTALFGASVSGWIPQGNTLTKNQWWDWIKGLQAFYWDVDWALSNTTIAKTSYHVELLKKVLGWYEAKTGLLEKYYGWARQLGRYLEIGVPGAPPIPAAPHENAVVIGTGVDDQNPLKSIDNSVVLGARSNKSSIIISAGAANQAGGVAIGQDTRIDVPANAPGGTPPATGAVVIGSGAAAGQPLINDVPSSVKLGAHSNVPSIVIAPGAANQAGSVAIGQDTTAGGTRAVVIGSGIAAVAAPAAAAAQPLSNPNPNSVRLGANSNEPSIIISAGAANQAGGVAIGQDTRIDVPANAPGGTPPATGAVVIGSGAAAGQPLINDVPSSVKLGAHSNVPSIVIAPGAANQAGSVAIGQDTMAGGTRAVVIGSGIAAVAAPAAAAAQPLSNPNPNSVRLGANSNEPSIIISAGAANQAGGVAIGQDTRIDVPANAPGGTPPATGAVVIGSGAAAGQPLINDVPSSVKLGAHSNVPSIVIAPGAANQAGSVAIGQDTTAGGTRAVVIGSGIAAVAAPAAAAAQPLSNPNPNSVRLGANSNEPSIIISAGAANQAGGVAIGQDTRIDVPANAPGGTPPATGAVVIGSGAAAGQPLINDVPSSVKLGAHSNVPSIVIAPGAANRAGSVAIGHEAAATNERSLALGPRTNANANDSVAIGQDTTAGGTRAVVIGSGIAAVAAPAAAAAQPLSNPNPNSVRLGANSNEPSIIISAGAANQAGGVAIGQDTRIDVPANAPGGTPPATGAVVIGSGAAAGQPLINDVPSSVKLGAHSNVPSIVIAPGAANQAGSVAIGQDTMAGGTRAVVIGSGIAAVAAPAAAAAQPLSNPNPNSVRLGANSNEPSIIISAGAANQAGGVAIGQDTRIDVPANAPGGTPPATGAVVIGSGAAAGQPLINDVPSSVKLGAHSNVPSIVIAPGAANRAGSVAIGHEAAATNERSLALGPRTNANANDSVAIGQDTTAGGTRAVVIGSGIAAVAAPAAAAAQPLSNPNPDSVVLGANSNVPSIVISPGAANQAGSVAIGQGSNLPSMVIEKGDPGKRGQIRLYADIVPPDGEKITLGGDDRRLDKIYVSDSSIHIGEKGNEGTIGYDKDNRRLKLGTVGADALTLTGSAFQNLPDNANWVALERSGKLVVSDEVKRQIEKLKNDAQKAKTDAETAKTGAETAKGLAETAKGLAETAATAAGSSAAAAAGSMAAAVGAAAEATGAATTATGAAAVAVGSAAAAAGSMAAAVGAAVGAEEHKTAAERAARDATDRVSQLERTLTLGPGTISIHTDLVPESHNTHSLGTAQNRWKGIYAGDVSANNIAISTVRGAGSNKPSIVIGPGAQDQAGSVAIGQDASATSVRSLAIGPWTSAEHAIDAVVIGSGQVGHELKPPTAVSGSVALGAQSNKPSIVIWPGKTNEAGGVAIGPYTSIDPAPNTTAPATGAVVIGSGDGSQVLRNNTPNSVVLGAHSNEPSIVISPGAGFAAGQPARAGSVAIGPYTRIDPAPNTTEPVTGAVVIGSGFGSQVLRNNTPNSVVLGARSNEPSIVISPGAANQGGSVAIGPHTRIDPAPNTTEPVTGAVVIGSGFGTDLLINKTAYSVMLGACSTKPSIVISPGATYQAGTISIHTDLVPEYHNQHTLGTAQKRWKSVYAGDVSANNLVITGFPLPDETNFVALDNNGRFKLTNLIETLSRRVKSLETENDYLKSLFTSDLSWSTLFVSKSPLPPQRTIRGSMFVALSEGNVTLSYMDEAQGRFDGQIVTYQMLEVVWYTQWGTGVVTGINYEQECRPIATDGAGKLYALDRKAGEVTIYKAVKDIPDGHSSKIITWSLKDQQGRLPSNLGGIAVDRAGQNVYVTFSGGVVKYGSDGKFLLHWGTQDLQVNRSDTPGKPRGIAVDDNDFVYVAEEALNRIQKFHSNGSFVDIWRTGFSAPIGLAVDDMRCIYVTERDTRLIKKLKLSGDHDLLATWDAKAADSNITKESMESIVVDRAGNVYLPAGADSVYRGKQTWRLR